MNARRKAAVGAAHHRRRDVDPVDTVEVARPGGRCFDPRRSRSRAPARGRGARRSSPAPTPRCRGLQRGSDSSRRPGRGSGRCSTGDRGEQTAPSARAARPGASDSGHRGELAALARGRQPERALEGQPGGEGQGLGGVVERPPPGARGPERRRRGGPGPAGERLAVVGGRDRVAAVVDDPRRGPEPGLHALRARRARPAPCPRRRGRCAHRRAPAGAGSRSAPPTRSRPPSRRDADGGRATAREPRPGGRAGRAGGSTARIRSAPDSGAGCTVS